MPKPPACLAPLARLAPLAGLASLLLGVCVLPVPLCAAPERVCVRSNDTLVELEAQDNQLVLRQLRQSSNESSRQWIVGSPQRIPFVEQAFDGATTLPLSWKFTGHGSMTKTADDPGSHRFSFRSTSPSLTLTSDWRGDLPFPSPIRHTLTITNNGPTTLSLPLQKSLLFDTRLDEGQLWWVEKGAAQPTDVGVHREALAPGLHRSILTLPYTPNEPAERDAIPWVAVHDPKAAQGWYAGLMYSGRSRIELQAADLQTSTSTGALRAELGIDSGLDDSAMFRTRLAPGQSFTAPEVFVGCFAGEIDNASHAMHRWVEGRVRRPVPFPERWPLLVNNSWGSGMAVDEPLAKKMIDDSAEVGLELFHLDAGWFRGVGDWHPLQSKFPHGMAALADYAHAKGLKFGLWVAWTQGGAQRGSEAGPDVLSAFSSSMRPWFRIDFPDDWKPAEFCGADVCLGDPRAVKWCRQQLLRIVRDYHIDLLEHDQRMIVESCSREDHLHLDAPGDITYHACRGYYQAQDEVYAQNPGLLFEDCVNGGRMVDFGAAQRVHYFSITDSYDPLSNRRAFFDASYVLPPSMCECYVANHPGKSLGEFRSMLRSGMMGWCTIMLDMGQWSAEQRQAGKRAFSLYKSRLRPLIAHANLYHVSDRPDGVRWDAMQYYDPQTTQGALFVFRGTTGETRHTVRLKGLSPQTRYRLESEDETLPAQEHTGKELMSAGLTLTLSQPNTSEIVFLQGDSAKGTPLQWRTAGLTPLQPVSGE